jgi:YD repeat-containing protein
VVQAAPKAAAFRIPQGDGQVLLVFTLPDDPKAAGKEYAVAVGDKEGSGWNLLTDQIFFYDDPHKLFSYWKPEIWKSIDEHRAIVGMNERQVMLALGQVSTPHGDTIGDRTVDYDDQGHPKSVTYQGGKATAVRDE